MMHQRNAIDRFVVTAQQMSQIEARVFAAGMPVAALMEKVAGRIADRIQALYPQSIAPCVGVLVGPGHNGGDALVVARELHFAGYAVKLYQPFSKLKDLTAAHADYAASLGIPHTQAIADLQNCDLIVDGLFGFGLSRSLEGEIAAAVDWVNQMQPPIVSIDLPSGLHTDTGAVLGTAVRATRSICLGLWKLAFMQDQALEYLGIPELIDFDLPLADIQAVVGDSPTRQRITSTQAIAPLITPLSPVTHKYKQGHLLLIAGSRQYGGAAILSGLGARASGIGMLSIAVPESLKSTIGAQLPEALIIACPEQNSGAIAHLPGHIDLSQYNAIACGCGLTPDALSVVQAVIDSDRPLLLDADGLNILSTLGANTLASRSAVTVLTPHAGEFKRLFPGLTDALSDRAVAVQRAAESCEGIVLLKGARTAIAVPPKWRDGKPCTVWFNPESTPALGRGGSGDVLTGLLGGLLAQADSKVIPVEAIVQSAAWWHSQAGLLAARKRSARGVDAFTLTQFLIPALKRKSAHLEKIANSARADLRINTILQLRDEGSVGTNP